MEAVSTRPPSRTRNGFAGNAIGGADHLAVSHRAARQERTIHLRPMVAPHDRADLRRTAEFAPDHDGAIVCQAALVQGDESIDYGIDILDRVELHPDFDPRRHYQLTLAESEMSAVERAAASATSVDDIEL